MSDNPYLNKPNKPSVSKWVNEPKEQYNTKKDNPLLKYSVYITEEMYIDILNKVINKEAGKRTNKNGRVIKLSFSEYVRELIEQDLQKRE